MKINLVCFEKKIEMFYEGSVYAFDASKRRSGRKNKIDSIQWFASFSMLWKTKSRKDLFIFRNVYFSLSDKRKRFIFSIEISVEKVN